MNVTIAGHTFQVADKYAEGHVLSANEASAMNQLRRENIRNNTAKKVKEFAEANGGDAGGFQAELDTIAEAYEFGARTAGGGASASRDPVSVEARAIARTALQAALKQAGKKRKDYTDEQWNAAVETLANREDIVEQARERVTARQSVAGVSLDELVGSPAPDAEAAPSRKSRKSAEAA